MQQLDFVSKCEVAPRERSIRNPNVRMLHARVYMSDSLSSLRVFLGSRETISLPDCQEGVLSESVVVTQHKACTCAAR